MLKEIYQVYNSILQNDGATYNVRNLSYATTGFSVAINKDAEIKINIEDFEPQDLFDYIKLHEKILFQNNFYLGAWVYENKVYLDVSIVLNKHEAIEIAKTFGEIAIFDLSRKESIFI